MKTNSITYVIFLLLLSSMISSCAFLQKEEFAQRKYYDFPRTKHSVKNKQTEQVSVLATEKNIAQNGMVTEDTKVSETLVSASLNNKEIIFSKPEKYVVYADKNVTVNSIMENVQKTTSVFSKKKSDVLKSEKNRISNSQSSDAGIMMFLMVIAAIFIPPLGVYMKDRPRLTNWFWVTLVLCILSGGVWGWGLVGGASGLWLVAAIIALLVVFDII